MGIVRLIAAVAIGIAIVPFHRLLHVLIMDASPEFIAVDATNIIGAILGAIYFLYEIFLRPRIAK